MRSTEPRAQARDSAGASFTPEDVSSSSGVCFFGFLGTLRDSLHLLRCNRAIRSQAAKILDGSARFVGHASDRLYRQFSIGRASKKVWGLMPQVPRQGSGRRLLREIEQQHPLSPAGDIYFMAFRQPDLIGGQDHVAFRCGSQIAPKPWKNRDSGLNLGFRTGFPRLFGAARRPNETLARPGSPGALAPRRRVQGSLHRQPTPGC